MDGLLGSGLELQIWGTDRRRTCPLAAILLSVRFMYACEGSRVFFFFGNGGS